jgi:hypothetical protein
MRFGWGICATLSLALGGCTAPLIDEGVKKFHTGSTQANALLVENANDVVAITRFGLLMNAINPPKAYIGPVDVSSSPSAQEFAQYVCAQSTKFALLRARQGTLARLDLGDGRTRTQSPTKQELEAKIRKNFEDCTLEVQTYVLLRRAELPNTGSLPQPREAGLALEGMIAGFALIGSAIKLLKSVYDGVEAEYKAGQIKSKVTAEDTQKIVIGTLDELSQPDNDLIRFCNDGQRTPICEGLLPKVDPNEKEKYFVVGLPKDGSYRNACDATTQVEGVKPAHSHLTMMDNATLYRRWMALRIAYYRYLDALNYQTFFRTLKADKAGKAVMPAFESRRRALDLAVAHYAAIQPAADIVVAQKHAWAELTAMSCGKLDLKQHVAALNAFADRINVLSADGKAVSDAWTGYATIVYPKPENENNGDN